VRIKKLVRGRDFPQPNRCRQFKRRDEHVAIRQNYTGMVENIDRLVGLLLDELKKRGEMDNTLVVYSSDHGEMLGDHNRWGKVLPRRDGQPVAEGPARRQDKETSRRGPKRLGKLANGVRQVPA